MRLLILILLSFNCFAVPAPYSPPKDLPFVAYLYVCGIHIGTVGQFQGEKFEDMNHEAHTKMLAWTESGHREIIVLRGHLESALRLKCRATL